MKTKSSKSKVKRRIIKKWVNRLKGDKYKQGKFQLCSTYNKNEFHCCLGVLCEIAVEEGIVEKQKLEIGYAYGDSKKQSGILPDSVVDWAGLNDYNDRGDILLPGDKSSLVQKNDGGWSFKRIANLIERKILGIKK